MKPRAVFCTNPFWLTYRLTIKRPRTFVVFFFLFRLFLCLFGFFLVCFFFFCWFFMPAPPISMVYRSLRSLGRFFVPNATRDRHLFLGADSRRGCVKVESVGGTGLGSFLPFFRSRDRFLSVGLMVLCRGFLVPREEMLPFRSAEEIPQSLFPFPLPRQSFPPGDRVLYPPLSLL